MANRHTTIAAILALGALAGCRETPSYQLRWSIDGRGEPSDINCAESGLFQVRARVYGTGNLPVDERIYPCAADSLLDAEGMVGGSPLVTGEYTVELRGLDRAGDVWVTDTPDTIDEDTSSCRLNGDPIACGPADLVCDCKTLSVTNEETTATLPEFVLVPPPECIDGIDNDADGLVDASDASCDVDAGLGGEGLPVGVTELRLALTLLGQNPNATCSSVPLRQVRVEVVSDVGTTEIIQDTCRLDRPYIASLRIPAGAYTFSMVGLDGSGEPVTITKIIQAEISESGGTVNESIDFAPEDFTVPIDGRISFSPAFLSSLGRDDAGLAAARTSCSSAPAQGNLDVAGLRVSVLTGHNGPLDPPVRLDNGLALDGSEIDCGVAFLTENLQWGSYAMTIEAVSAEGEVCFGNADTPVPMRPNEQLSVVLPRTYVAMPDPEGAEGAMVMRVPESCRECEVATDCQSPNIEAWACIDGACQLPCEGDQDCFGTDGIGDLGFVCEADGYCHPPVLER